MPVPTRIQELTRLNLQGGKTAPKPPWMKEKPAIVEKSSMTVRADPFKKKPQQRREGLKPDDNAVDRHAVVDEGTAGQRLPGWKVIGNEAPATGKQGRLGITPPAEEPDEPPIRFNRTKIRRVRFE